MPIDDLWTSYTRGFMLPIAFKDFSKQTDEKGNITYITEMTDTIRPATMPYLIEIINGIKVLTSVREINVSGFATQYSLSICEPTAATDIIAADEILPIKTVSLPDGTMFRIAAAKLRTWGRIRDSPVILSCIATIDGSDEHVVIDITDQIEAQPLGDVIRIFYSPLYR